MAGKQYLIDSRDSDVLAPRQDSAETVVRNALHYEREDKVAE